VRTLVWAKQPCQRPRERSDGIPTGEDQTAVGHGTASSGLARLHLVRERVVADNQTIRGAAALGCLVGPRPSFGVAQR
jgi:hypothetical protein